MAEGHRGRYRDRFENESIDNIPEYAVLEKILHGVIVRQDTSEMARSLIREFGDLAGVIDASAAELQKIKGVGPAVISFLKNIPNVYERYCISKADNNRIIRGYEDVAEYLREYLGNAKKEKFVLVCFDGELKCISCKTMFEDIPHPDKERIKEIVDFATVSKASFTVIAHNHIEGELEVSDEDMAVTKLIYNLLSFSHIHLNDHIIVKGGEYISLAKENKMPLKRFDE